MSHPRGTLDAYTLFCGVILLEERVTESTRITPWLNRLGQQDGFLAYLNKSYYRNFIQNIEPGSRKGHLLGHFTIPLPQPSLAFIHQGTTTEVDTPYFDLFLFPNDVAIFAFKAELRDSSTSYDTVSAMVNHLRQPAATVRVGERSLSVQEFIQQSISPAVSLRPGWDRFIPQLKSYTIINDPSCDTFHDDLDNKLYELSHVLPIGASVESEFMPTPKYREQIMSDAIAVYNNWKAIALFDTFTRISCSYPDTYKTWEQEYFLIYVHGLYTKFRLYSFNNQLSNVGPGDKATSSLRGQFVEFVQRYQLAYISYKFLPNLIFDKINQSLELKRELSQMEEKLERFHLTYTERKSQQMNQLLLVISVLSVLSVIADLSGLLVQLGLQSSLVYSPVTSVALGFVILMAIYWIYRRREG